MVSAQAATHWDQLKVGMSADEALQYVGEPLLRAKARGLERWIYDGAGEVVFYGGPVQAWTVPSPSPLSAAKPVESDVMFRPPPRGQRTTLVTTPPPATYEQPYSDGSRFRYR